MSFVEFTKKLNFFYHNGHRADSVDSFYTNNNTYINVAKRIKNWGLFDCVLFSFCFWFQIVLVVVVVSVDILRGVVLDFWLILGGGVDF